MTVSDRRNSRDIYTDLGESAKETARQDSRQVA